MNKTEFKIAMADHKTGKKVARDIYDYLLKCWGTKGIGDEEWFDLKVNDILMGCDGGEGWSKLGLTDYQAYALLGAAMSYFDYDTGLFFGITSYGTVGHYIYFRFVENR